MRELAFIGSLFLLGALVAPGSIPVKAQPMSFVEFNRAELASLIDFRTSEVVHLPIVLAAETEATLDGAAWRSNRLYWR